MNFLDILKNDVLMVSLSAWLIAQLIKIIINAIVNKTFSLERLFGDGGMPSGHSATVTAAALMIGLHQGFASPLFGLALVVAIIVMHDACGVRYEAGKHANSLNNIINTLNEYIQETDNKIKEEKFKTLVGHTHLQVFFGALTGIFVVIVYMYIFKISFFAGM
jgi:acid phosphatase family membrane protein YuiD